MSVRTRKSPATKVDHVPDAPVRRSTVRVGAVNDPAEADADRLAAQAMALSSSYDTVRRAPDGSLAEGFDLDADVLRTASSSPQQLDDDTRGRMEQAFGRDLGDVRVHTDDAASDLAADIGARAFTHGQDVYFGAGEYQPGSAAGDHVLAHELAHTAQASAGVHRYPASWVNTPVAWGQQTARVVRPGGGVSGGVYIMHSQPQMGPVTTAVAKPTFGKNAAGDTESGAQIVAADRLMREFGLTAPVSRVVKKGSAEYGELIALCQPYAPQQPAQGQPGRDNWQPLTDAQDFVVMSEIANARTLKDIAEGAGGGGNDAKLDLLYVLNDQELMHDFGLMMVADMVIGNSDRFLGEAKNLGNVMVSVLNGQRTVNVFDTTAFLPHVATADKFLNANPMVKGGINLKFATQNPGTVFDEMIAAVVQVVKAAQPQVAQGGPGANGPSFGDRLESALTQQRPRLFGYFMGGWNAGVAKAVELSQGDNAENALGDLAGEENVHTEGLKAVATYVANADDKQNKVASAKAAAVVAARIVSEINLQKMAPEGGIVDPVNWVKVPSKVRHAEWVDNPLLPTPADVSNVQPAKNGDFDEPAYRKMKNNLIRARGGVQDALGDKKRMFKSQPRNRAELGRAIVTAEAVAAGTFWLSSCSHHVRRAANRLAELTPVVAHLTPGDASSIASKAAQVEQFIDVVASAQAPYDRALTDAVATVPRTTYTDAANLVTTLNHAVDHSGVVTRKLGEARGKELYKLVNALRVQANTRTA